jgi:hypothetical protein
MTAVFLGIDQQSGGVPFYDTQFNKARKYLRINILTRNKGKAFEKEADDFTSDLGYKWPSKLGNMLKDFIEESRHAKKGMTQDNFTFWKNYFLSRGYTLWQVTEFYRAFTEESKAGSIGPAIRMSWTYDPSQDKSIYSVLSRYALIGIAVYVGVPAIINVLGRRIK